MNKIILIGNLTRDIEVKQSQSGKEWCAFSIAVERSAKDKDGERQTDFFDIVAGGAIVPALAKYGKKGKKIGVAGTMQQKTVETKSGDKRTFYNVLGETFDFLTPKSEAPKRKEMEEIPLNDDCPF